MEDLVHFLSGEDEEREAIAHEADAAHHHDEDALDQVAEPVQRLPRGAIRHDAAIVVLLLVEEQLLSPVTAALHVDI